MNNLLLASAVGIGGTVFMDLWSVLLNRVFAIAPPNWGLVGRWAFHLKHGVVFHSDIQNAQETAAETRIGWAFHYGVGIIYGVLFIALMGADWLKDPSFLPVWVFSVATIAAGWFLLHPGLGLGIALSKTPNPHFGRAMGLLGHTVFGLGMWCTALLL